VAVMVGSAASTVTNTEAAPSSPYSSVTPSQTSYSPASSNVCTRVADGFGSSCSHSSPSGCFHQSHSVMAPSLSTVAVIVTG
jgi:hypothetical protein